MAELFITVGISVFVAIGLWAFIRCPWRDFAVVRYAKCFASTTVGFLSEPRLPRRTIGLIFLFLVLRILEDSVIAAAAAVVFLIWISCDASAACAEREADVRRELAISLKVAAFAQGAAAEFAESQASLHFADIRRRTHCLFAARAHTWGNDWEESDLCDDDQLSANIARSLPRFYRFCLEVHSGKPLDAFVFEVRGREYGADVQSFARTVRRVLTEISDADPAGVRCMRKNYIGKRGWYFQFAREPLFVTTFAPCYPDSNPRYQFDLHSDSCFLLFQPEESFFRHDIPQDRPRHETNWDAPQDIRDRIRVNFKQNGREYLIPETTQYPTANFVVAATDPLKDPPVKFWRAGDLDRSTIASLDRTTSAPARIPSGVTDVRQACPSPERKSGDDADTEEPGQLAGVSLPRQSSAEWEHC